MADFERAFDRSLLAKSGYVERPDDNSGEAYKGVSRRFHPSWDGWEIIDALKLAASNYDEFNKTMEKNQKLKEKVRVFFKQMYWDRFCGDTIPNQEIAVEIFETSVEMGVRRAVGFFQEVLNLVNASQSNYRQIIEDGIFGPETLKALEACLKSNDTFYLAKVMSILQGMQYIEKMRKNPNQGKYVRDWFKRIKILKESPEERPAPPTNIKIE